MTPPAKREFPTGAKVVLGILAGAVFIAGSVFLLMVGTATIPDGSSSTEKTKSYPISEARYEGTLTSLREVCGKYGCNDERTEHPGRWVVIYERDGALVTAEFATGGDRAYDVVVQKVTEGSETIDFITTTTTERFRAIDLPGSEPVRRDEVRKSTRVVLHLEG